MTRMTRRILFYCALILFIGASYVVLLYAQGYKYDFTQGKFIRSGAIYIKVNTGARIVVDGKEVSTTSLLGNSASVGGLLPGTHILSVQKTTYSTWQKKVTTAAGFVDDFTRVMLLPQAGLDKEEVKKEIQGLLYPVVASPSFSPTPSASATPPATPTSKPPKPTKTPKPTPTPTPIPSTPSPLPTGPFYIDHGALYINTEDSPMRIASDVSAAQISDDDQKLMWFSGGEIWVYWLSDTDYQPVHHAGDIALVGRFNKTVKAAKWFRDSDHIALDAGGLKVIEIDTRPGLNIINF